MAQPHDDSKSDGEGEASIGEASETKPTGYSGLGQKITNWTSNLLATAVVVMVALVVGTQLVSSFKPDADSFAESDSELMSAWPELESCALKFGDSSLQFQRDSIQCSFSEAVSSLQTQCRLALEAEALPSNKISERESAMIANVVNSGDVKPIEESPGKWRIFQISTGDDSKPDLPMIVGVRDDLGLNAEATAASDHATDRNKQLTGSRLVVWGLAIPHVLDCPDAATTIQDDASQEPSKTAMENSDDRKTLQWTTFVARSAADEAGEQFKSSLIPTGYRRTLAIANPNGGSMIGFVGEPLEHAIQFYDKLAVEQKWTVSSPWRQNADTLSAQFKLPKESAFKGIQVQLHVNHNETVRGMLMVQPK